MITPAEAFGIDQCIQLMGVSHPTSVFLAKAIIEVKIKEGSGSETQAGIDKAVSLCIEVGIAYPNQANLNFLFVGEGNDRCKDKPKASAKTQKHPKDSL